jgi:hypothetical protein
MIEAKLLVGRYLKFTPTPQRKLQGRPPQFEAVVCPPLQIAESQMRGILKREANVLPGVNANKIHRNFKWLPYYLGDISNTDLTCDVLTGPMSGCILVSYKDAAGSPRVGHVGTVSGDPGGINGQVKTLWNTFATNNAALVVGGFNPIDATIPILPAQKGDSGWEAWGLFTTGGDFYTIHVWTQSTTRDDWRVAAVHKRPSMTLAQLQNLP